MSKKNVDISIGSMVLIERNGYKVVESSSSEGISKKIKAIDKKKGNFIYLYIYTSTYSIVYNIFLNYY